MRFTTLATVFGLAVIASAQASSSATPTTASLSPAQVCLAACGRADICCQARCVNVPCPNELQANSTTECAAQCVQGDGSQEQTERYAKCQQSCISSLFFPLSATASPTGGASGSTAATTTSGSGNGGSSTSRSGSPTGATPAATTSPNAAPEVRFGTAGAGLVGLLVAALIM